MRKSSIFTLVLGFLSSIANIKGVSPYAVPNNMMTPGSLCIGSIDTDYGYATGWSTNTAGIMMECSNITEICVHDSGTRVASLLYYYGPTNQIYIGRDKGWGVSHIFMSGYLQCLFYAISNAGTDYVGVANADGNNNLNYSRQLFLMFNTFTGFHRCFTDDIEFKKEDPQKFKDDYVGRIVVSSGKIATLATKLNSIKDLENKNIVRVDIKKEIQINNFANALDFFRLKNIDKSNFYYHHVGIYGYQYETLKKFISLKRSDNEINRSLEQMRAMDNDISISVGLTDSYPLGVDTIEDLEEIRNIMKNGQ